MECQRKRAMKKVYYIGLDIAKNVFQVFLADADGRKIANRKISRSNMFTFFANLQPCTIGMEACGTAHFWARTLQTYGHKVNLIPPIRVKAFLGNRNKTDAADAQAICEALMHPGTNFVSLKTEAQQDVDHVLGMRTRLIANRTQLVNQIRSFLSERGIAIPRGYEKFRNSMPDILAINWDKFSDKFQMVITESLTELEDMEKKIKHLDELISTWAKNNDQCKKLMTIPGIGPITASAIIGHTGDPDKFANGRQLAAYYGLTPKEYSSGGKQRLLGITKHGNRRIRTLLVLAARAIMTGLTRRKRDENGCIPHFSGFEKWILELQARIGTFKAATALANKLARLCWAIMKNNEVFNPIKASATI